MRFSVQFFLMTSLLLFTGIAAAHADVYVWQDPVSKASLSVPDTWRMIHNQKNDDVVSFAAPGENDAAICRMRVRTDRRFVIYPQRYSDEIQRINYSYKFWDDYLGEFDGYIIHNAHDNAGLGRGFASFAEASFVTDAGPKMQKRGIMFASLYRDKAYIVECSAEAHVFDQWRDSFMSVARSVDFRKAIHEFPAGDYRDFLRDATLRIKGPRPVDATYY